MKTIPGTEHIYITKQNGKTYFSIKKTIEGKLIHFGTGKTLIEALMVRDYCTANNWEKKPFRHTSTDEKHICKSDGGFRVQKTRNGKTEYYGFFNCLEDAVKERDLLIKYDWDLETLCDLS